MPSIPLLSYGGQSQDKQSPTLLSPADGTDTKSRSSRQSGRESVGKAVKARRKSESSSKEGKKSGKKKRRPAKKVSPRNGSVNLTGDKVEEMVARATAHAEGVRALKQAILEIQLILLDGVQDKARLQSTSRLLTQSEYSDVVTERSISSQCGYPLCHNGLTTEPSRKGRYRISLLEHKVYDLTETRLFCCANCLVASKTFQSSLQIERDEFIRKEKVESIMDYIREPQASNSQHGNGNSKNHQHESVPSNETLVSSIQEREDQGISSFDDAGPFDAIEGYVPQRHWPSTKKSQNGTSDELEWGADLERMAIVDEPTLSSSPTRKLVSLDKGKSPLTPDELGVEIYPVPILKSALKKGKAEKPLKRNVSWEDQKRKDQKSERREQRFSARLKERAQVRNSQSPPTVAAEDLPILQKPSITGDSVSLTSNVDKLDGQTNLPGGQISDNSVLMSCNAGPVDTVQDIRDPLAPVEGSETPKPERVLSAEAVAAALTEAAEAVAGGEIGSEEAVAQAGLCIVSATENVEEKPVHEAVENGSNVLPSSGPKSSIEVDVRWPPLEPPEEEEDDLDFTTAKGAWHHAPPRNFKVEVSMFGTIWMALEEWISAATIAHFYGKEPQDEDEFVVANGREFKRQAQSGDSTSREISRMFSNCIARAFPDVVEALRLTVPISVLEQNIGRLIRTMTFIEALPAFSVQQWGMILLLLLDGLSAQRLPSIGVHLAKNMSLLHKFLDSSGTSESEYDTFRGLILPLGRLPTFSIMSEG